MLIAHTSQIIITYIRSLKSIHKFFYQTTIGQFLGPIGPLELGLSVGWLVGWSVVFMENLH